MRTIKLISPNDSVKMLSDLVYKAGFRRVSRNGNDSFYFTKNGTFYKARISNHRDQYRNDDVIIDVVFTEPTTVMDIEYRLKMIQAAFGRIRMKVG